MVSLISVLRRFCALCPVVKKMEIPLETAVACATINPAKSLGIEDTYGSIAPGKKANIVLLDENLELKMVIKDGQEL